MKQQGMALLIILLVLGLMAGLAAEMTTRLQGTRRLGEWEAEALQKQWDYRLAETQALEILRQDLLDNAKLTSRDQRWAQPHTLHLPEGATLSWQLQSAQRCFNLNALAHAPLDPLADPPYNVQVFQALLEQLGVSSTSATSLVAAIADYIDDDSDKRRDGAEDDNYADKPVRYVANQPFFDVSELRTIKGMTPRLYQKLAPYVCVLGGAPTLQISINALRANDAPLVAALMLNEQDVDSVRRLLEQVPKGGWTSSQQLIDAAKKAWPTQEEAVNKLSTGLTATSDFFTLTLRLQRDQRLLVQQSSIYYQRKEQQLRIYARR